jgi:hypothetical protein
MQPSTEKPAKEPVREYMERRVESLTPPPSLKDIRRQLGRELAEQAKVQPYR